MLKAAQPCVSPEISQDIRTEYRRSALQFAVGIRNFEFEGFQFIHLFALYDLNDSLLVQKAFAAPL